MHSSVTRNVILSVCFLLLATTSFAADLIIAPDDAPMYKLSNLRMESDNFGRSVLAVDYQQTRESESGFSRVQISGKTKNGDLDVIGFGGLDKSGTARIRIHTMFGGGNDFEIFFVADAGYRTKYLVSNVMRLGNPGTHSKARALTAKEKEAIAKAKLRRTPPAALPDGYVAVDQGTTLVPGMPVKAGWYGEWKNAEVVSFKVAGSVMLKYEGEANLESHSREKWIAIDPEVLSRAQSNPDQFEVSVRALPDSTKIIPNGAVALADDVELLPGTPLLLDDHGSSWSEVFAIETQGDQVNLRHSKFSSSWDKLKPRTKLVITEKTLSELTGSDRETAKEKFAKNLLAGGKTASTNFPGRGGIGGRRSIRHKQYKIDITIPKGAQLVPDDLTIENGTVLAGCWARKWRPITALSENEDGSLHVHWDEYSDAWDCNMTRDQLIIEDKTIRKLKRKAAKSDDDLKDALRTWTDSTGKYKVEAWYVRRSEKQVILKTDAGREFNMPIEKLSEEDRALLPAFESDGENPFK